MSKVGRALKSVTFAGLCGACGYFGADAANDVIVYRACRRAAMEHGAGNATLLQQLGEPLRTGPWYNASVGVTHGGLIGNCTLSMVGSRHSADVAIRISRKASKLRSPILHALFGGGEWDVLTLEAVLPDGRGLTQRKSLLEPPPQQGSKVPAAPVSSKPEAGHR